VPGRASAGRYARGIRAAGGPGRVALRRRPLVPGRLRHGRYGGMAVRSRTWGGDVPRPGRGGRGHGPGHHQRLPPPRQRDAPDLVGVRRGRPVGPARAGGTRTAAAVCLPGVLHRHGHRSADRRRPRSACGQDVSAAPALSEGASAASVPSPVRERSGLPLQAARQPRGGERFERYPERARQPQPAQRGTKAMRADPERDVVQWRARGA